MSCWFAVPSCRPAAEATACFDRWRAMGYRIAVLRQGDPVQADLVIPTDAYLGWSRSTNILCREILRRDPAASWVVGGGDDYRPSLSHPADDIAFECCRYFLNCRYFLKLNGPQINWSPGTFGVMQPTGDRWGDDAASRAKYGELRGAYIDRVAGSPWMGREWIERAYLGNGPMWDGYHHCFADEELQEVATTLGVFWQRPDLTQHHDHPGRKSFNTADWPAHLAPAITGRNWNADQAVFRERKLKGFPGHEPI